LEILCDSKLPVVRSRFHGVQANINPRAYK